MWSVWFHPFLQVWLACWSKWSTITGKAKLAVISCNRPNVEHVRMETENSKVADHTGKNNVISYLSNVYHSQVIMQIISTCQLKVLDLWVMFPLLISMHRNNPNCRWFWWHIKWRRRLGRSVCHVSWYEKYSGFQLGQVHCKDLV